MGGMMPQYRIPVPPTKTGSTTTTNTTTVISGSSSSTTTNTPPTAQTTSATTSVLAPSGEFQGVIHMAKAFVVLTVTVGTAARVRLYGTNMAQIVDAGRPITQGPGFGTEQNIIGDMVLDTPPVVWQAVDMVGANGDNPQSTAVYITVDNLSNMSTAVTVSVVYRRSRVSRANFPSETYGIFRPQDHTNDTSSLPVLSDTDGYLFVTAIFSHRSHL